MQGRQTQLTLGEELGLMPQVPLFIDETVPAGAIPPASARWVIARLDLANDSGRFAQAVDSARLADAAIAVELVLDCRDADAETRTALERIKATGVDPTRC